MGRYGLGNYRRRPWTKQSRARKGAVEGSPCVGGAIGMRSLPASLPEWTAPLRARLCSESSLEADRLKGGGLRAGDQSKKAIQFL